MHNPAFFRLAWRHMDRTQPSRAYLDHLSGETAARMASATPTTSAHSGAHEALAARLEQHVEAHREALEHVVASLHAHPETAFQEHRSARTLVEVLERAGATVTTGVGGVETAFRAEVGAGDGPTIAILAGYDALPEVGHACGHNVIAATGVGAFLGWPTCSASSPVRCPAGSCSSARPPRRATPARSSWPAAAPSTTSTPRSWCTPTATTWPTRCGSVAAS